MDKAQVLIVDDSLMNQAVLRNILQNEYEVFCASSGMEMFSVLEETDPKLILLDVVMPEMDGFAIIEKLKSGDEYSRIPVIFITGLNDAKSEERGFSLGAIDYITKPFIERIVLARVRSYVQLYEFIEMTERMGRNDGLTGLLNKRATEEQIQKQLSVKGKLTTGALMIIDIDNFKSINDSFGHLYGDAVISQLGSALRGIFQKSDILGRVGGDEFFVFLRNYKDKAVLIKKAEEVGVAFRKTHEQGGVKVDISASIGIATMDDSVEFEQMYKLADIALYNSKAKGKNCHTFYEGQEELSYVSERTQIERSSRTRQDPSASIDDFNTNFREFVYNYVEGSKVAEYTIQSIMQLICAQFSFTSASISKLDYADGIIKYTKDWSNINPDKHPVSREIGLDDITGMYNAFEAHQLLVSGDEDELPEILSKDKEDRVYSYFPLRNKKVLLGYLSFESAAGETKISPKQKKSIVGVCQQLSTVIINQFLLSNAMSAKENITSVLNNLSMPVYVTSPQRVRPMFINEAAKAKGVKPHGRNCFTKGCVSEACPLKAAVENGGFYENEHVSCKEISWSEDGVAYVITEKM